MRRKYMEKWVVAAKKADFNLIGRQFHIDPVIARLIRNWDVAVEEKIKEYLLGTIDTIPSPWLMKDMKKAVDILEKKIQQQAKIRIIGDYDIDGVTSTYILLKGLTRIGANVDTYTLHTPSPNGNGWLASLLRDSVLQSYSLSFFLFCSMAYATAV